MEQIEFLDGFKAVEPFRAIARRVSGILALGTTTEICLSNHIKDKTPPVQTTESGGRWGSLGEY